MTETEKRASLITIRTAKRRFGRAKYGTHYAVTGQSHTLCKLTLDYVVRPPHAIHPVGQRCSAECKRCRRTERGVRRMANQAVRLKRDPIGVQSGGPAGMPGGPTMADYKSCWHWDDWCTVCGKRLREGSLKTMHKTCAGP